MTKAIITVVCLWWSCSILAAPHYRSDLVRKIERFACNKRTIHQPTTQQLWKVGIYDAGLKLYFLRPQSTPNKSAIEELEQMARNLSSETHQLGYAIGHCKGKNFWVATTPSPFPMKKNQNKIEFEGHIMARYCRSFRVDYAHAAHGKPRRIYKSGTVPKKQITVRADLLDRGTLSVTCKPKPFPWLGPVLWALKPVKSGPYKNLISSSQPPRKNRNRALSRWINQTRQDMGLPPLKTHNPKLQKTSKFLINENFTVSHNRNDLKKMSSMIKSQKGRFIGENRVKAQTFEEAAWLLWNSPRHRSLLLSSKATHLSTVGKLLDSHQLSVMVFAKF